ncbi:hypothetical protein [Hoeflea poritis]|uniref:Lipoprotein n=1 Tax=Hoeflea poritis TaxID=2993659 RepID=A0ABT4VIP9_9HYPH|nr:hypothetical protein [Hoeflea poritis]MDA4844012.1 hypothetical protein [Hoeflea poritis]
MVKFCRGAGRRTTLLAGVLATSFALTGCFSIGKHYFGTAGPLEAAGPACSAINQQAVYEAAFFELMRYDGTVFSRQSIDYRNVSEKEIIAIDQAFARNLLRNNSVMAEPSPTVTGRCRITFKIETYTVSFKAGRTPMHYRVEYSMRNGQIENICLGLNLREYDAESLLSNPLMTLKPELFPNLSRDAIVTKNVLYDGDDGQSYEVSDSLAKQKVLGSPCFDAAGQLTGYKQLYPELAEKK